MVVSTRTSATATVATAPLASSVQPSRNDDSIQENQQESQQQQQQQQQQEEQEEQPGEGVGSQQQYHAIRHCTTGLEGPAIFWNYQDVRPYLLPQFVEYSSFDNILDAVEYIGNGGGVGSGGGSGNDDIATSDAQAATTLADIKDKGDSHVPASQSTETTITTEATMTLPIPDGNSHSPAMQPTETTTTETTTMPIPTGELNPDTMDNTKKQAPSSPLVREGDSLTSSVAAVSHSPQRTKSPLTTSAEDTDVAKILASTNIDANIHAKARAYALAGSTNKAQPKPALPKGTTASTTKKRKTTTLSSATKPKPAKKVRARKLPTTTTSISSKKTKSATKGTTKKTPKKGGKVTTATDEAEAAAAAEKPKLKTRSKTMFPRISPEVQAAAAAVVAGKVEEKPKGKPGRPKGAKNKVKTTTTITGQKATKAPPKKGKKTMTKKATTSQRKRGRPKVETPKYPRKRRITPEQAEAEWEGMLGELRDFKAIHGHCNVPFLPRSSLLNWVVFQRRDYERLKEANPKKKSKMTPKRLQLLTDLGFKFQTGTRRGFDERAVEWLEWSTKNNKKIPPRDHPTGLSTWCKFIRCQHVKFQREKERAAATAAADGGSNATATNTKQDTAKIYLTQEQIDRLSQWGFVWDTGAKKPPAEPVPWEGRLEQLLKFKSEHGHTMVPQTFGVLGNWVLYQRKEYKSYRVGKKCSLTAEKVKKLDDIDFVWTANRMGSRILKYKDKSENRRTGKLKSPSHQEPGQKMQTPSEQQHEDEDDDERDDEEEEEGGNDNFDTESEGEHEEHGHQHEDHRHDQSQQPEQQFPGLDQTIAGVFQNTTTVPHNFHPGNRGGVFPSGGNTGSPYPPSRFPGYWG